MFRKLVVSGAAAAAAAAAGGYVVARQAHRDWGIDPDAATRPLPGDDLVPEAEAGDTRTIEIDAPPAAVWPWLVQMGYGRAGWYSYDQLDMNHPSLGRIVPELQAIAVGDIVPTHPGGGFEVKVVEPEHALVLYMDRALARAQAEAAKAATASTRPTDGETGGAASAMPANLKATGAYLDASMPGEFAASWAFVVEPIGEGRTRLIERFRAHLVPTPGSRPVPGFATSMLGFGVFVMTRRQMLGIKARAEGVPETGFIGLAVRRRLAAAPSA